MKIICVGRNYAEHAAELGNAVPEQPLLFLKPSTALLQEDKPFYYPDFTQDLHHEIELVVKISKQGKYIAPEFAANYYEEVGLGIDFTARDLQQRCKTAGHPWEIAKAFDHSAVVGRFLPLAQAKADNPHLGFRLDKNGQTVQAGDMQAMIHSIEALIVYASRFFTLQKGDLLFTGTPKGVSAVQVGDLLEGFLGGDKLLHCEIK